MQFTPALYAALILSRGSLRRDMMKKDRDQIDSDLRSVFRIINAAKNRGDYTIANLGWAILAEIEEREYYLGGKVANALSDLPEVFLFWETDDEMGLDSIEVYYDLAGVGYNGLETVIPVPLIRPQAAVCFMKRAIITDGEDHSRQVRYASDEENLKRSVGAYRFIIDFLQRWELPTISEIAEKWLLRYASGDEEPEAPTPPEGWGLF